MRLQNLAFSLLLLVCIVASGCVGQESSNLGKITENPEDYVGEKVTLRGQIQIKKDESIISQKAAESTVDSKTIRAKNAERKIGTLDGEIPMVGKCKQSDYASEVKVRGTIESYETCNCEVKQEYVRIENRSRFIVINEDLGTRETYNQSRAIEWSVRSNLSAFTKSDLDKIDESVGTNLSDHLDLGKFSENESFSSDHFRENGEWVNSDEVTEEMRSITTEEFKYTLDENALIIQENTENIKDKVVKKEEVLAKVCNEVSQVKENHHGDTFTRTKFNGCTSSPEKQYYFSCN